MTLEEFLALPEDGYRHEVSRGRLIREPPPGDRHGEVTAEIAFILREYLNTRTVGRLRTASGFRLEREPLTVRGADVSFIRHERLTGMQADPFF